MSTKFFVVVFLIFTSFAIYAQKRIVGYFPNWQIYDTKLPYKVKDVPFEQLTHIQYAFYLPQIDGTIKSSDDWADQVIFDGVNGGLKLVEEAHKHNVKVCVSIGGWTGSDNFPIIAADENKRKVFAHSVKEIILKYDLDGIDIDWEYPCYSEHNGTPQDDENFVLLLKILRDTLNTFSEHKEISLAVPGNSYLGRYYKVNEFEQYIDFISVMTYDYTGEWDNVTWYNSPLYDDGQSSHGSFDKGIQYYLSVGFPKEKINGGIPFYGRSFAGCDGPNQEFSGVGSENGYISYRSCIQKLNNEGYSYHWDDNAKVPYLTGNNEYITFDDTTSIRLKCEYIKDYALGGAMIWELSLGMLDDGTQPLLQTIYNVLNQNTNVKNFKQELSKDVISISPNPFNPATIISFNSLSNSGELIIYNSIGQLIENYKIDKRGLVNIKFNGATYSSGVYFVKAITNGLVFTKKMILLK